jgi:hypothetical protein
VVFRAARVLSRFVCMFPFCPFLFDENTTNEMNLMAREFIYLFTGSRRVRRISCFKVALSMLVLRGGDIPLVSSCRSLLYFIGRLYS